MYQLGSLQRKLVTMIVKLVTIIVKYNYVNLTIELSQYVEDDIQNDVIYNVVDNEESRELSSDLSPEHDDKQLKVDHSDNLRESVVSVVEESQEEKIRRLFAKRTNEDTAMSAKERYLARQRTKLLQLTISTDDE